MRQSKLTSTRRSIQLQFIVTCFNGICYNELGLTIICCNQTPPTPASTHSRPVRALRPDRDLQRIRSDFDKYVSERAFEDICRQFVWQGLVHDRLPAGLTFDTVGSWWLSEKDHQDEIDVVASNEGRAVLVGECKWSRQPVDRRDLDGLRAALHRATPDLDPIDRPWKALFSRTGFSKDLVEIAANHEERILLLTPDDLYGVGR